ncbi:general substrate transporter [Halteromyces radiatus]|uniref:general substrate transporter n=1 Tax=Halteromyces radiatus TaxID=101107 RepID=UPI00221FC4F0|nr:general substrate transporter [Halteromyces radiatus]KAI8093174.1 general substrate transporter [Halteromyces radiatus]
MDEKLNHDDTLKEQTKVITTDLSGLQGFIQNPYLFGIAIFSSLGGLLFGYDQGVISGIQDMENFKKRFPVNPVENGLIVSILEFGAWLGTLIIPYMADKISRKYSIAMATCVFLIGSALQSGAQKLIHLMIGRFVAGLGVGSLSTLGPLYQSELSSPQLRGSVVSLYQLSITLGVAISFWIDYGTSFTLDQWSWRLPLLLQMVFGLILLVGVFFLPFSPRWLMKVGREQEALHILARLRQRDVIDPMVEAEWKDIKVIVMFDRYLDEQRDNQLKYDITSDGVINRWQLWIKRKWISNTQVLRQGMWKRVLIGSTLLFFQQLTGVNAIVYYAPFIINSVGLTGNSVKLLATGVIGVIMVCCCIPTVLYLDKVGRRILLLVGSVGMAICMLTVGSLTVAFQHDWVHHSNEAWLAVIMIYIFMGFFAFSWGPVPWVVSSELFPLRVRAKAMGITSSSHWMNNFIVGFITPPLLAASVPSTYYMFSAFCILSIAFVWFLIPETKGKSLEEMDIIYGGQTATEDAIAMERIRHEVDMMVVTKTHTVA